MKNTSKIMYRIGNIVNIFYLGLGALLMLIGIICVIVGFVSNDTIAISSGSSCLGTGIWMLVSAILCFVFVGKAQRELTDESTSNVTPFVVTIVFGAISANPLYVLAGIFGLIADKQQGQEQGDSFDQPAEDKQPE